MFYKLSIMLLSLFTEIDSIYAYLGINQMNINYSEENISYVNKDAKITISGTITIPNFKLKPAVVILVAGYGPHDRNLTFAGKQLFKDIAKYLTQKGIAVLRYDKRGVGESTGDYSLATSRDFADDVKAGIEYLKTRTDIDQNNIGLIGLSEGGLICSMVASESEEIAFVVLLAAAVVSKIEDFVKMSGLQMLADGASQDFIKGDAIIRHQVFSIVKEESDAKVAEIKLRHAISDYLNKLSESEKKEAEKIHFAFTQSKMEIFIKTFNSIWYRYFLNCDASEFLKKIKVPVLALNGDLDWIAYPGITFKIMENAFAQGAARDYKCINVPGVNHMFQVCKSGAMAEYSTIQETMSLGVLNIISDWILSRIK